MVLDHAVWSGPGYNQENLLLDIYILSNRIVYNYAVTKDSTISNGGCTFLEEIEYVSISKVSDTRSPYVLAILQGSNRGYLFGGTVDQYRLERFRRNLIAARAKLIH